VATPRLSPGRSCGPSTRTVTTCRRRSGTGPSPRSRRAENMKEEKRQVIAAGGLHVLGTERHEARRIDRQLAGRAGRQGDPGSCQFFLSLDDELLEALGPRRQTNLRLKGERGGNVNWNKYRKIFLVAQRKTEKRHYKQRRRSDALRAAATGNPEGSGRGSLRRLIATSMARQPACPPGPWCRRECLATRKVNSRQASRKCGGNRVP